MVADNKNTALIEEVKRSCKVPYPLCDEYERMISGMIYKTANDLRMQEHKVKIMRHMSQFNAGRVPEDATLESLQDRRMSIAAETLGNLGQSVNIVAPFFVIWGCNTFVGDNVYMNRNVQIHDDAPVWIGKNVRIAMDVCISTGTHQINAYEREETGGSFALPIRIEDHCWIGARATILPGVTIGEGSMVAAGAVVTKDVDPYCVVGGVPARVLERLERPEVARNLK